MQNLSTSIGCCGGGCRKTTVDAPLNERYTIETEAYNTEQTMSEAYKSWEEYTPLEQAAATWWDMYKDAYNFRPRGTDTSGWTLEKFQEEMKYLQGVIERNDLQRRVDEDAAIQVFEARVTKIIELGARDRAMALRWIHEAEGTGGDNEYLCYCVGVPYGYIKTEVVA